MISAVQTRFYKYAVLALLYLGWCISYIDRAAITFAATHIASEFHLEPSDLGLLLSSFFLGYSLLQLPGGWLIIDQIVDQAPNGLEVLRGNSSYIYDGNWKMQMENGCDGYHVSTVHWNYAATMGRRKEGGTRATDANNWSKAVAGVYGYENGHILLWTNTLNPEVRPIWNQREELAKRVGQERADIIVSQTRNLCIYPNVFLMDQFGTQIRVARPIGVDKTEISIFCFGPKGESAADRTTRIRQYEDFFNVSGMGTADDLEEFRACQAGYAGSAVRWNDMSRGAPLWIEGPDENAKKMGMKPLLSGERSEDEGLFICQHHYWTKAMRKAIKEEREGAQA